MHYRTTSSIEDMHRIVELETVVWGLKPIDVVPISILTLSPHNGGVLIIAEEEQDAQSVLVGFSMALPARRHGEWILWSHMTGVHPQYQQRGIGRALKIHQKKWAAANGYLAIGWTFDPLQSGNANFNLMVLGASAVQYHENHYGQMDDEINALPLPSDRLEAYWKTTDMPRREVTMPSALLLDDHGAVVDINVDAVKQLGIPLPARNSHASHLAKWQQNMKTTFQIAFEAGYLATGFVRDSKNSSGCYVLTR